MSEITLKQTLDEAEWSWLRDHAERDALIIVSHELELLQVGEAIAADSSKQVGAWIGAGQLTKPTPDQLREWNESPSRRFMSLVVAPYVLIQEIALH